MSDSLIDKLTRFTPTDRLDRDDMLFRAGRASTPGRRMWMALAGLLAVGQVTTLTLWFTQPGPAVVVHEYLPSNDVHESPRPTPDSYGSLRANWDGDTLPTPTFEPARTEPLTYRTVWSDPALK